MVSQGNYRRIQWKIEGVINLIDEVKKETTDATHLGVLAILKEEQKQCLRKAEEYFKK